MPQGWLNDGWTIIRPPPASTHAADRPRVSKKSRGATCRLILPETGPPAHPCRAPLLHPCPCLSPNGKPFSHKVRRRIPRGNFLGQVCPLLLQSVRVRRRRERGRKEGRNRSFNLDFRQFYGSTLHLERGEEGPGEGAKKPPGKVDHPAQHKNNPRSSTASP